MDSIIFSIIYRAFEEKICQSKKLRSDIQNQYMNSIEEHLSKLTINDVRNLNINDDTNITNIICFLIHELYDKQNNQGGR